MKNVFGVAAVAVSVAGLALAAPALAHHSAASYDLTKRTELSGVLQSATFRNPHGEMMLKVKSDVWKVETSAANLLRRRGWDFTKFKPGSKITIFGHLNKTVPHQIYIREVHFADGTAFGDKDGNDKALD